MNDYRSPIAEMLFTLAQGAGAQRLANWDAELVTELLTQAGRFIDGEIAPLDQIADSTPPQIEGGRVRLDERFHNSYQQYKQAGWPTLSAPDHYGGQAQPEVLATAVSEMLSGACISFQMLLSLGQGAIRTLRAHATPQQQAYYLPRLISGEWLATMCLSEPTAGSDLGQIRSIATPQADGRWHISGTKVFISGGDQDMTENIVHLVLARTPDAPPGSKGLALFICPAIRLDGARNGVTLLRLEEKMGLHAAPTCQLAFDAAEAEILGAPGEGLQRMFTMMNAERLDVAAQGVGLAEVARQRAWRYANERTQGRAVGSSKPIDTITHHGDVQQMLLQQHALATGTRAMLYRAVVELELEAQPALVEFLTPVCKAFCTEAAVRSADLAIQIHGGYGYCKEYRVEQIYRDARITTIYEGTNGIQAMTLAGRLIRVNKGACVDAFSADVESTQAMLKDSGLTASSMALGQALADWRYATDSLLKVSDPGAVASSYMRLTGLLAFATAWGRLELAIDEAPEPALYRTLALFVRERMLPETRWLVHQVCQIETSEKLPVALFAVD